MGIIIRQSLKASFITYVGVSLGVINQLFISTHYLSATEIGISRSLLTFSTIFSSVFSFGVAAITDKYFALFNDDEKKHNGFLSFLFLYIGVNFLIFCIFYWASNQIFIRIYQERSPELVYFYTSIAPFTGLIVLQTVLETYCRNVKRIAIPAFFREVFLRLTNILIIFLYGLNFISFEIYVYLTIASYLLNIIGLFIYLKIIKKLYLTKINWHILNKSVFKEIIIFGFIVTLSAVGSNLSNFLDQAMIGAMMGQADTGIFSVSMIIAMLIEVPRKSINQISIPFLTQALHKNDWQEVQLINQQVSKHQFLAGGLLVLYVISNLDDIFAIMPKGAIFAQGKYVVILLSCARLLDMTGGMTSEIMGYSKYYHISTLFVVLLGVLTYFTNLFFIPKLGITGAALATVITILCFSLAKIIFIKRYLMINVFHKQILIIILLGMSTFLIIYYLPLSNSKNVFFLLLNISIRTILITAIYIGVSWKINISPEMNLIIKNGVMWIREKTNRK